MSDMSAALSQGLPFLEKSVNKDVVALHWSSPAVMYLEEA